MTSTNRRAIGYDDYLRQVFVGDEVRDASGRQYTILQSGWAKPLDGGTEVPYCRIRGAEVVRDPGRFPFVEGPDGRVGPATRPVQATPRTTPDIHLKGGTITIDLRRAEKEMDACARRHGMGADPVKATSRQDVAKGPRDGSSDGRGMTSDPSGRSPRNVTSSCHPVHGAVPGGHHQSGRRGGRPNASGWCRVSIHARHFGMSARDARPLLEAAGIELRRVNESLQFRICDLPRFREALSASPAGCSPHVKGRPNNSGVSMFRNIARAVGRSGAEVRAVAERSGLEIVSVGNNLGIRACDRARLVELVMSSPPESGKLRKGPRSGPGIARVKEEVARHCDLLDAYLQCRATRQQLVASLDGLREIFRL